MSRHQGAPEASTIENCPHPSPHPAQFTVWPISEPAQPPHHHTRVCHQNEAMAVAGVVIELGRIRQSERQRGIGEAPGVPAPYVGIRNEMTSARRPVPYACDTSFGAVQPDKYQVDLIPAGFGLGGSGPPGCGWKGSSPPQTHSPIEILRRSLQDLPSGGDGRGGWMQRIQTAGYRIGIQQSVAALEIGGSRQRGLSGAVRPCDTVSAGALPQAACAVNSRVTS